jgi:hypothetical protein
LPFSFVYKNFSLNWISCKKIDLNERWLFFCKNHAELKIIHQKKLKVIIFQRVTIIKIFLSIVSRKLRSRSFSIVDHPGLIDKFSIYIVANSYSGKV